MLIKLFNKIFKPTIDTSLEMEYSYFDDNGWYVMKPEGWKVGVKMSPDNNTFRVDMKSLHEHVFGGEDGKL